jgi:Ca2+/H+ antiporter, TMEM165/GDT1 family
MKARWVKRGLKIGLIAVVAAAIFGFMVMSLWNWLAPAVFGLHTISFWQALGILILSKLLFGGFRGRPGYGGHWRRRMNDRWQQMTPEEREQFRQGMFGRCGRSDTVAEGSTDPGRV